MRQILMLAVLLVPCFHGPVSAAPSSEDPVLQGVRLSEWLERLRGEKEAAMGDPILLVVGGTAYRGVEERLYLSRRGGLVACQILGNNTANKSLRRVVPALLVALREDRDPRIREAAAAALGRLSIKVQKEEARMLGDVRDGLVAGLRTDRNASVRQQAASALGQTDPESRGDTRLIHELTNKLDVLVAAIKDPEPAVSNAAAETIRRMGKNAANASADLIVLMQNPAIDPITRTTLATVLGRIGTPEALPSLKEILKDAKTPLDLRRAICDSLAGFGKDAADLVPTLAEILMTPGNEVELRRASAGAIDRLGSDGYAALGIIKKGLKDDDKFVRCLCLHSIGQMGKELGKDSKDVITALLSAINDPAIEVRVAVLETFGNLGKEGLGEDAVVVMDRLDALTRDGLKEIREAAENSLRKLKMP